MKKLLLSGLLLIGAFEVIAQSHFPTQQVSINGFRNPSIGAEYQHRQLSIHAGYYVTNFTSGTTTKFLKTGINYWFLPVDKKEMPSSFYAGASYMRGLNRDYKSKNAVALEAGFRWFVWQGLNLRIGAIAVAATGENIKVNPTPGISYTFKL